MYGRYPYVNRRLNYGPGQNEPGPVVCRQQGLGERAAPAGRGGDRAELPGGQRRRETTWTVGRGSGDDGQAREARAEAKGQLQLGLHAVQAGHQSLTARGRGCAGSARVLRPGEDEPPLRGSGPASGPLCEQEAVLRAAPPLLEPLRGDVDARASVSRSHGTRGSGIPLSPRRRGRGAVVLRPWGWRGPPAPGLRSRAGPAASVGQHPGRLTGQGPRARTARSRVSGFVSGLAERTLNSPSEQECLRLGRSRGSSARLFFFF